MRAALSLQNVSKSFQEERGRRTLLALRRVTFSVSPGEFFVILGPSGSGKSTLLRILAGLDRPDSGSVAFGADTRPADVSMVFQRFALLPWLTVAENIALGLLSRERSSARLRRRIAAELRRFGLTGFAHAYPRELSGGMRQRVGLARAFATDPKIILLDEPFSELDAFTAAELRRVLRTLWEATRPTIIMVSHLIEETVELADRIAVLTPRPGRIERIVRNHLPRPRERRSEAFFRLEDTLAALVRP